MAICAGCTNPSSQEPRRRLVIVDGAALHTKPDSDAPIAARLGSGLVAEIERERGEWRRITVNGARGWAPASALWGADRHRFQ